MAMTINSPGKIFYTPDVVDVMGRTVWGEARGETDLGKAAVAWVIRNRVMADLHHDGKPDWWGEGVAAVCKKPWQFSCWNPDDPNASKCAKVDVDTDAVFARCLTIAARVLEGEEPDPTGGATHYCRFDSWPRWRRDAEPEQYRERIGAHVFYRLEG